MGGWGRSGVNFDFGKISHPFQFITASITLPLLCDFLWKNHRLTSLLTLLFYEINNKKVARNKISSNNIIVHEHISSQYSSFLPPLKTSEDFLGFSGSRKLENWLKMGWWTASRHKDIILVHSQLNYCQLPPPALFREGTSLLFIIAPNLWFWLKMPTPLLDNSAYYQELEGNIVNYMPAMFVVLCFMLMNAIATLQSEEFQHVLKNMLCAETNKVKTSDRLFTKDSIFLDLNRFCELIVSVDMGIFNVNIKLFPEMVTKCPKCKGWPKKTWLKTIKEDFKKCKLGAIFNKDHYSGRESLRIPRRAQSEKYVDQWLKTII